MSLELGMLACAGDFAIKYSFFVASSVAQKVVSHDGTRVVIVFNDGAGSLFIGGPSVGALGLNASFTISSSPIPVILNWYDHSILVQEEFWIVRTSGNSNVTVTEVLYRPSRGMTGLAGGAEVIH